LNCFPNFAREISAQTKLLAIVVINCIRDIGSRDLQQLSFILRLAHSATQSLLPLITPQSRRARMHQVEPQLLPRTSVRLLARLRAIGYPGFARPIVLVLAGAA